MKKIFAALLSAVICFVGIGLGGCGNVETHVTVNGMIYWLTYPRGGKKYYASDTYEDLEDPVVDALFLEREVNGIPVKGLGVAPGGGAWAREIDTRSDSIRIGSLYCPGSITDCGRGYLNVSYLNEPEAEFRIFYCGDVADLSFLGYNGGIVYYVPSDQLAEYEALWATFDYQQQISAADDIKIKAANVEYHLNAEGMEEYFYIDYVENGEVIQHIPPKPTRKGYDFLGWYSDEDGTQEWEFDSPIAVSEGENLALFAKWQEK